MSTNMRGPLDRQPNEPGWWLAADGKWYPPESAPGYQVPPVPPATGGNGFAVTALVLGIVGVLFGFIPLTFFVAGTLGVIALIFGLVARSRTRKRGTKRGMATSGTILGVASILLSIIGFVILVAVVNDTSKKLNEIAGGDPAKYDVVVSTCTTDSTLDLVKASGTLVNTTDTTKSFIVSIRFMDASGTQFSTGTDFVNDVAPGKKAQWSVMGTSGGNPSRCEISSLSVT